MAARGVVTQAKCSCLLAKSLTLACSPLTLTFVNATLKTRIAASGACPRRRRGERLCDNERANHPNGERQDHQLSRLAHPSPFTFTARDERPIGLPRGGPASPSHWTADPITPPHPHTADRPGLSRLFVHSCHVNPGFRVSVRAPPQPDPPHTKAAPEGGFEVKNRRRPTLPGPLRTKYHRR